MEPKRAKEVLEGMNLEVFTAVSVASIDEYFRAEDGDEKTVIDGRFTADQLEAIATWMRDPDGVVKA